MSVAQFKDVAFSAILLKLRWERGSGPRRVKMFESLYAMDTGGFCGAQMPGNGKVVTDTPELRVIRG